MIADPSNHVVHFPGPQGPEQVADPHRDVIASLTKIIRQISDLASAIKEGPTTDADMAKYPGRLSFVSALCLRAQIEYFDQFTGGSKENSRFLVL